MAQPTHITTRNADEVRKSLREEVSKSLAAALSGDDEEAMSLESAGLATPAKTPAKKDSVAGGEDDSSGKQPSADTKTVADIGELLGDDGKGDEKDAGQQSDPAPTGGEPEEKGDEPGDKKLQARIDELEATNRRLERQYKSIQSAITPTQQENARLRKRLSELEGTPHTQPETGGGEAPAKARPVPVSQVRQKLEGVRDVFPEGVEIFDYLLNRVEGLDALERQQAEAKVIQEEQSEADKMVAIASVMQAHPDAKGISQSEDFWTWVYSHGKDVGDRINDRLNNPWTDVQDAIDIFNDYKDYSARVARRSGTPASQPPVAQPPSAPAVRKVPTDMAASVRSSTTARPGGSQAKVWTDADWANARVEMNNRRTSPERMREIRDEMRKQMLLVHARGA